MTRDTFTITEDHLKLLRRMASEFVGEKWSCDEDGRIEDASGTCIARVQEHANINTVTRTGEYFSHAHGRLIAAAPDLLEALQAARSELSNYDRDHFGGQNKSVIDCIADIDAVVAKATGAQP